MLCVEKEEEASEGDGGVGLELEEMGCVGGLRGLHTPLRLKPTANCPFDRSVASRLTRSAEKLR